jgi:hypothetical protein
MDHQHRKQIAMRRIRGISPFMPQKNLSWSQREALRKEITVARWEIPSAGRSRIGRSACSAVADAVAEVTTESGEPSASCTTGPSCTQAITTIPQSFAGRVRRTGTRRGTVRHGFRGFPPRGLDTRSCERSSKGE